MVANLPNADDIILSVTSEAELQELVDRPDRVSRKYSLLMNVDKTKVMASDDMACCILIQNEQLKQVDMFPYFGSLITIQLNISIKEDHAQLGWTSRRGQDSPWKSQSE